VDGRITNNQETTMKGKMNTSNQGKTHTTMNTNPGKGAGANKRDSAVATGTPSGGSTKRITRGEVKRSTGSFAKYK
jgi:hypothetical protein